MTDERILVLMPTSKDGERMSRALAGAGLASFVCKDMAGLCREIGRGAGVALLTEEAVASDRGGCLQEVLRDQPPWSDFPLVVLAREGEGRPIRESMNVTLVERPVRIRSLLSVVRAALRSRRHQYEVRSHLETIRRERERLHVTLSSIGDAVIATDAEGRVSFMNAVAEALTVWPQADAAGRPLHEVFRIVNEHTREPAENPALRALREGAVVGLANHTVLIARDGMERPIDDSAAPIWEGEGQVGAVLVFRDVSDRRRAEEDRARLAAIVESSDDAIVSKSLDGVIRSWNAGAERLFGYTAAEAVGRPITLIIPPERYDEEPRILERLRRGERLEHFETVRLSKDGRRIDVSLTISPLVNAEGEVVGASKVARDVTSRKRVEAERERLAETLGLALAAADQGTWDWDPATDLITISERAAEIYGIAPGAHGREWMRGLIHPDHRDRSRDEAARAVADRTDYDVEYLLESGTWVAARGGGVYGPGGELVRMLGVVQDVTARKRAELALRESEERLRRMINVDGVGVLVFALPEGRLVGANDYFLRISGYTRAEVEAGSLTWRTMTPPEYVEASEGQMAGLEATGRIGPYEKEYFRKDGSRAWMVFAGASLGDGTVVEYCIDIGDRKRAEAALREADRQKDAFIALLAHELRNPLAPIRNGLQVLRLAGDDAGALARARAMMDRQMTHMVRLVDDLLDVSRINRGKMELRRERVALSDVVASAVETAGPLIDEAGHELSVTLPGGTLYLDADLTRLAQVFANLLTNSAKYTPKAGRIWLSAGRRGGHVEVSVRDTGIGIPAPSLPRIFDMFSQVDRSIERSTGGLGIGLALVKCLVEMHGGTVTVASEGEGKGSTFTVTLPVLPEWAPPATAQADAGQAFAGSSRRMLVVDDNRDGADSLALMLRLMGNEVRTANDGVEAVTEVERFRPEVILMDVGMPRMNGLEATRRIREQPWGRAVKIIALTGWGQENDRERSREAGCDGHLVKPVDLASLQRALAEVSAAGP